MLAPSVTKRLIERTRQRAVAAKSNSVRNQSALTKLSLLTAREMDVLEGIAEGRSNDAIAGALFVSEATVKTHVSRILAKLEIENRVQAALLARDARRI